jgi:hypothetical protein
MLAVCLNVQHLSNVLNGMLNIALAEKCLRI